MEFIHKAGQRLAGFTLSVIQHADAAAGEDDNILIERLVEGVHLVGGDAEHGALAQAGDAQRVGSLVAAKDGLRQCLNAEGAQLLNPIDNLKHLLAVGLCAGGEGQRLHAALVVDDHGLGGLAVIAFIHEGDLFLPGVAAADQAAHVIQRQGGRGGRGLRLQRDSAGGDVLAQRSGVNCLAGGLRNQRAQHIVAQLRIRGDIERGAFMIGREGGDEGCGGHRVRLAGMADRRTDQADQFLGGEAVVRAQTHDHGAVLLRLGGEEGLAVGGAGGHLRQNIRDGLRDARSLVVILVIEDDVAVYIHKHPAGARPVDIGRLHGSAAVILPGMEGDGARLARHGPAGEGNAHHPGARTAHARDILLLSEDGHVQIIGGRLAAGGGADAQARARRAGNDSRHTAEGILRLCAGACAGALQAQLHAALPADGLRHLRCTQAGNLGRDSRTLPMAGVDRRGHGIKLPVAIHGLLCSQTACRKHQDEHEQREESGKRFHIKYPPL